MTITVNINEAREFIVEGLIAGTVPNLIGSPAIGKSSLILDIAKEYKLFPIDYRLSQADPTDLMGFPSIDKETNKARYLPMSTFPLKGDSIPKGYDGWLLFFDELTLAAPAVQKAAYKILLDRMVGEYHLHEKVAMVCAGNLLTDNAMVEELSTALQTRLAPHLEVVVDSTIWLEWAWENKIDKRITSFIQWKPGNLYNFHPDHNDHTYASPRTWEFLNRFIKNKKVISHELLPLIAGTISEGVAREFRAFTEIYDDLITIPQILKNPVTIEVPTQPSVLYALIGSISENATKDNLDDLVTFICRIPSEFQVVCLREVIKRNRTLASHSAIHTWKEKNRDLI